MCANHGNSSIPEEDDFEHIVCPFCEAKIGTDTDTHCKHVAFVVIDEMVNRFNMTDEMNEALDKSIGNDLCDTVTDRKLNNFCKKFDVKLDIIVEHGMCCGPVCTEYTFGFKE